MSTNTKKKKQTNVISGTKETAEKAEKAASSPIFSRLAYIYIAVPFLIFVFGWFKLPLALMSAAVIIAGLYFAMIHAPSLDTSLISKQNIPKIICAVIIAIVWVYMSGIGGYAFQNYDHMWRNAILEKLVESDWPVYINETAPFFESPVAMIYYFAFWLPAAWYGKHFGIDSAYGFLFIWAVIGILLIFYMISAFHKKISLPVMIAFIFFSGLDAVGAFIYTNSDTYTWFNTLHLENWAPGFQISSMTTQLFWVFNQAIPAWLITLLLLHLKNSRSLIFIYSFSLLFCTLPAVGLLPFIAYFFIRRCVRLYDKKVPFKKNITVILKDVITFQNVAAGGLIGITSFLFLKSNATSTQGIAYTEIKRFLMPYLMTVFFEFLIYYILIYKKQSKNGLFYVSLATLLIVPLIRVGPHVDFVMRASIPALVVLFVLIMDTLASYLKERNLFFSSALIITLALGGLTAQHEIMRTIVSTTNSANDPAVPLKATEIDLFEDGARGNFFGEYEDSFFFKHIAKK